MKPPSNQPAHEVLEIIHSPARMAGLLARLALLDRSRLTLLELPDSATVLDAMRAWRLRGPADLPEFEKQLQEKTRDFDTNPLWLAWMTHVHGDRLRQIADELTKLAFEPEALPEQVLSNLQQPMRKKATKKAPPPESNAGPAMA